MTDICSGCGRPLAADLTPEEVENRLRDLEPQALLVLEGQLMSLDERVRQSAAKLLLEWQRGKPKQQVQTTTDQITTIRYESAAWIPDPSVATQIETQPIPELTNG
jgi:hypothetical protein